MKILFFNHLTSSTIFYYCHAMFRVKTSSVWLIPVLLSLQSISQGTWAEARIKNIVFDFGGVLIQIQHSLTASGFRDLGATDFELFYSQNRQDPVFEAFEAGRLDSPSFRDFARNKLSIPHVSDAQFDGAWNALIVGYDPRTIDFLKAMSKKYNIYLLSNTNEIHYNYFSSLYETQIGEPFASFLDLFRRAYFAHEMNLKKPHPEIYQQVLVENQLNPAETLYVDDTKAYVEGGMKVGMPVLWITSDATPTTLPRESSIFAIPDYVERFNLVEERSSVRGNVGE